MHHTYQPNQNMIFQGYQGQTYLRTCVFQAYRRIVSLQNMWWFISWFTHLRAVGHGSVEPRSGACNPTDDTTQSGVLRFGSAISFAIEAFQLDLTVGNG